MTTPDYLELAQQDLMEPGTELRHSLTCDPAFIPPKFFYDQLGSALFTAICELPEYYPTRTESAIFQRWGTEIARAIGLGSTLIDLGAGDCQKAARLFEGLRPSQYVAVDISVEFVRNALECLQRQFPELPMLGLGTDFSQGLQLPAQVRSERRVFFYPGSSIGNFAPEEARNFLRSLHGQLGADGALLLGADLAKPAEIVEPAYADALGVTAAFNLNVLLHVNRLLGSDFRVADFEHQAFFNQAAGRIEMHLRARRDLRVSWSDGHLDLVAGQTIHTENSYKHGPGELESMLGDSGFRMTDQWSDERGWFAVVLARPV